MPTLHLPAGQNYGCIQCGRSCTLFHEIGVDAVSEARLAALKVNDLLRPGDRGKPYLKPIPGKTEVKNICKSGGTCVFMTDGKRCGVHAEHGFEAKPQVCQDFPYRFVETTNGAYTGLSFACTAVMQNLGPSVESQRADVERGYGVSRMVLSATGPIRLTPRHDISAPAYAGLEGALAELMDDASVPVPIRLCGQSVLLDMVASLLRQARGDGTARGADAMPAGYRELGRYPADSGTTTDEAIIAATRRRFITKEGRAHLFHLARRHQGSPTLQRAFLGLITGFRLSFADGRGTQGRFTTTVDFASHCLTSMLRLGRVELQGVGSRFHYKDFARLGNGLTFPDDQAALLHRYFAHMLYRKDLLLHESVWLSQKLMLMYWGLVRWYAVGHSVARGEADVSLGAMEEAVRSVELHYAFHTTFSKIFENAPTLGLVLDSIVKRPGFAASMICGAG